MEVTVKVRMYEVSGASSEVMLPNKASIVPEKEIKYEGVFSDVFQPFCLREQV